MWPSSVTNYGKTALTRAERLKGCRSYGTVIIGNDNERNG
nr:MAG TPA: hypothetical protein [Caudoviricetes sp.]